MSDEQLEILDELSSLETKVDRLSDVFIQCTTDLLEAIKLNTDLVASLGEVMALATSPDIEDLERSRTLREAFTKYEFVRKLALGEKKNNE